jgi:hypothetical protein
VIIAEGFDDMAKIGPDHYLPVESYVKALGTFHALAGLVLFEFAREERGIRDAIIRNFIARADVATGAVFKLWNMNDFQDCWVLHRSLLDRLFHLYALHKKNEFEAFEAWSFLEQYKAANRLRSDPEFAQVRDSAVFNLTEKTKERARVLEKQPPIWKRPKAEDVSKEMDMTFLYRYGFDYASRHVHPMADDGQQDFFTITKQESMHDFPDQRVILSNTLLVATVLIQEGLNASTLSWRRLLYDAVSGLRQFLGSGAPECMLSFVKLGKMVEKGLVLAAPGDTSAETGGI